MFEIDAASDKRSTQTTRRAFLAGAATVAVGAILLKVYEAPGVEASTAVHGHPGRVTIAAFSPAGVPLGQQTVEKIVKTDGEWYRQLGKNTYGIARRADTEMPYTGVSWREHRSGLYRCAGCDTALFTSSAKFNSGTGWPSFSDVLAKQNVVETIDRSLGDDRTEIACARCEGHLGHLFNDGPDPTGLRYCMNSAAMRFVPA